MSKTEKLLNAAEELVRAIGHTPTCKFTGCTCGSSARVAEALTNWARVRNE